MFRFLFLRSSIGSWLLIEILDQGSSLIASCYNPNGLKALKYCGSLELQPSVIKDSNGCVSQNQSKNSFFHENRSDRWMPSSDENFLNELVAISFNSKRTEFCRIFFKSCNLPILSVLVGFAKNK